MPLTPNPIQHHLVLPFAACAGPECLPAMKAVPPAALRNFNDLLKGMKLTANDSGDDRSLSPPHERVRARAIGLPLTDGLIPWAAWQNLQAGGNPGNRGWAQVTPCHWAMGRDQATLTDPAALGLQEEDARALLTAMQPYFATEGITLHYLEPTRWLAEGEIFKTLPSASLDRVLGRSVAPWLPGARQIRLLQNEMQMLLYTHPLNDARAAKNQAGINSFWISGTGALPDDFKPQAQAEVTLPRSLAQAAFTNDWPGYAEAWAALDVSQGARLLALQRRGEMVRLSLCGERNAMSFGSTQVSFWTQARNLFGPQPLLTVLEQL